MIASLMMCLSVVLLLIGMLGGIVMGIQENSSSPPPTRTSIWSAASCFSCSAFTTGSSPQPADRRWPRLRAGCI